MLWGHVDVSSIQLAKDKIHNERYLAHNINCNSFKSQASDTESTQITFLQRTYPRKLSRCRMTFIKLLDTSSTSVYEISGSSLNPSHKLYIHRTPTAALHEPNWFMCFFDPTNPVLNKPNSHGWKFMELSKPLKFKSLVLKLFICFKLYCLVEN